MPNVWLFKSEPDVFSIADLERAKGRTTCWDGVRNYQARNLLRDEVKAGDVVLFYHSSAEVTGVAGLCEIARAGYADPSQFDRKSKYHDPDATPDAPRWIAVDVRHVRTFQAVVTLAALKAEPSLAAMEVLRRGNRLSIQRVTAAELATITRMAEAAAPRPAAPAASPARSARGAGRGSARASSGARPRRR